MKLPLSLVGYGVGFGLSELLWGRAEGLSGIIPNLRIDFGGKTLTLHHWMLFVILAIVLVIFRYRVKISDNVFYFLLALCFGGMNHGISYKDWYKIWV